MLSDASFSGLPGMRFGISQRAVVRAWVGIIVVLLAIMVVAAIGSTHARGSGVHRPQASAAMTSRRVGPGPVAAGLSAAAYRVQVLVTPNRAGVRNRVALAVSKGDRPLTDARVTVTYSMPAMNMANVFTGSLRHDALGSYCALQPALGMPGAWQLRFEVTPRDARPFTVLVEDRMLR
jgi:YtkA-like